MNKLPPYLFKGRIYKTVTGLLRAAIKRKHDGLEAVRADFVHGDAFRIEFSDGTTETYRIFRGLDVISIR